METGAPVQLEIAVLGAGAVGGWYGSRLALGGDRVTLVTRRDAAAIRERGGIEIRERGAASVVPLRAVETPEACGPVDLVLVTMKATGNADLPRLLAPLLGPSTRVMTLQNGMGNVEALLSVLPPERVGGGLCFVCFNRVGPGVVDAILPGRLSLGAPAGPAWPWVEDLAARLRRAGVKADAVPSLVESLWRKLVWNVPFNGLAIAGGGITTDRILASEALRGLARVLMEEVVESARLADGVLIEPAFLDLQFRVTEPMGPYRPSSLIDYLEGRPVEVEAIWGEPLRRARAAGARAGAWTALAALIAHLVAARRP